MLRLHVQGFRCHKDLEVTIARGHITLIRGPSGSGKSTIFLALFWCLYGSVRGIYDKEAERGNTVVILETNNGLAIRRRGKPRLLQLTYGGKIYEGEQAQGTIDQIFGSRDVWRACCYIGQKEPCHFLTLSAKERMFVLNEMAFHGSDPREVIEKIATHIAKLRQQRETLATRKDALVEQCDRTKLTYTLSGEDLARDYAQEEQSCATLMQERDRLLALKAAENEHARYRALFRTRESQEEERLRTLPLSTRSPEELARLAVDLQTQLAQRKIAEEQQRKYRAYLQRKERYDELSRIIPADLAAPTEEERAKAQKHERAYRSSTKICARIGVDLDVASIRRRIEERTEQQDRRAVLEKKREATNILMRLRKTLPADATVPSAEYIDELREKIAAAEHAKSLLPCPACAQPLRYCGGRLIRAQEDYRPLTPEVSARLHQELAQAENARKQQEARKIALERISALSGAEITLEEEAELNALPLADAIARELAELRRVDTYAPPPVSSAALEAALERARIDITPVDLPPELPDVTQLQRAYMEVVHEQTAQKDRQEAERRLEDIRIQQAKIPPSVDVAPLLAQVDNDIAHKRDILRKRSSSELVREYNGTIAALEANMAELHREIMASTRLHEKAIALECRELGLLVERLNTILRAILAGFFSAPISVEFTLTSKGTKASGIARPAITLRIAYKGIEYEHVNELSGGEGERVSIALCLAFAQIMDAPLVLLDECWSSLDEEHERACLHHCEKLFGTLGVSPRTVLCVTHKTYHHDDVTLLP